MEGTPIVPYLLAVPLLLFATFFLLAQVAAERIYRAVVLGVAVVPALLLATLGLTSDAVLMILGMAIGLAGMVAGLGWLAGRLVYGRLR